MLINKKELYFEHGRLVLLLAEILPYIGLKLGLDLKYLAILYSLNHVLFHFTLCFICWVKFKQYNFAFLITLLQFFGLRESLYTPQFELYYGLSIVLFLIAFIQYKIVNSKLNWSAFLLIFVLSIFVYTSHPMAITCYFFLLTIALLQNKKLTSPFIFSIVIFIFYYIWKTMNVSEYELNKFSEFSENLKLKNLMKIYTLPNILNGFKLIFIHYLDINLLFFAGIFYLLKDKKKLLSTIFISCYFIVLASVWLIHEPIGISRYTEQVYFPWVFCCISIILFFPLNKVYFGVLFIAFFIRLISIINYSNLYLERTNFIAEIVQKVQNLEGNKFYISIQENSKIKNIIDWSIPFETLVYSAINNQKTVTICTKEDYEFNNNFLILKPNQFLFRKWEIWNTKDLNSKWFEIENSNYIEVKQ